MRLVTRLCISIVFCRKISKISINYPFTIQSCSQGSFYLYYSNRVCRVPYPVENSGSLSEFRLWGLAHDNEVARYELDLQLTDTMLPSKIRGEP